jgi:hypothetical protein
MNAAPSKALGTGRINHRCINSWNSALMRTFWQVIGVPLFTGKYLNEAVTGLIYTFASKLYQKKVHSIGTETDMLKRI